MLAINGHRRSGILVGGDYMNLSTFAGRFSDDAPKFVFIGLLTSLLTGCATQPLNQAYDPPGFFSGLWHGITLPISIFGSLFLDIRVYAFPNTGWFYDLGFFIGAIGSLLIVLSIAEK